ncbi:MAG: exodeoxyribonuclease III [Patescibacteria group bacterium]|jgi:exodeoxyribonuclease-3
MKILSWNVNGIRAVVKKGFLDFLKKEKPDFLCLQEIKIDKESKAKEVFDFADYQEFWHSAKRPGYSGTAILVKDGIKAKILPDLDWDNEGRIQVLDCEKFYLANIYFPNANHELSRLDFKLDFNSKVLSYFKKLEKKKPIIATGDFNVAHEEIDLARPKDNIGNPGFTDEERAWMTKFLKAGFVDTFRYLNKNKIQYSWWSYRFNARARNIGWRIDYFCVSVKIIKKIRKSFILDKVSGSDHCPAGVDVKF